MSCDGTRPDEIGRLAGRSGKTVRAWLRRRWPKEAPGRGGDWRLTHGQVQETLAQLGAPSERLPAASPDPFPFPVPGRRLQPRRGREVSDEAYVIELMAELLGEKPLRGRRFDWLRGDAGTTLPVDAYFPEHELVVEYRERQHLADRGDTFKLWDERPTASGLPRRQQRAHYDELREREIPTHGLGLLLINADDLAHDARGRLRRDRQSDRQTLLCLLDQDRAQARQRAPGSNTV